MTAVRPYCKTGIGAYPPLTRFTAVVNRLLPFVQIFESVEELAEARAKVAIAKKVNSIEYSSRS